MAFSSASTSHYFSFLFLLFCISTTFSSSHIRDSDIDGGALLQVEKITKALSDAGYEAMSLTLQLTLPTLLNSITNNNTTTTTSGGGTTVTIFCPPDQAFFSLKYPQPPLTLLQYHVVPMKLESETLLESSSSLLHPTGSKIDTLLSGHPLIVTTLPHSNTASINEVEIKKWDIYNDGGLIVHGVEDFFDPAYQTILYPLYDNNGSGGTRNSSGEEEIGGDGLVFKYVVLGAVAIVVGLIICVLYAYGFANLCCRRRADGYVLL